MGTLNQKASENGGSERVSALEDLKMQTMVTRVDRLEKKVEGNGVDGLDVRVDRDEQIFG